MAPDDKPQDEVTLIATKKEFIQNFFKRAGEFTDEILKENERLRFRILQLQDEARARAAESTPSVNTLRDLAGRITDLEREREQLLTGVGGVERQNLDFMERSREFERENNKI